MKEVLRVNNVVLADLSALLVRLAVAIELASSAHTSSEPLAILTSFSLISEF